MPTPADAVRTEGGKSGEDLSSGLCTGPHGMAVTRTMARERPALAGTMLGSQIEFPGHFCKFCILVYMIN